MLKKLILFVIFITAVTGFSKKVSITIVATTDTHANLTSYDYLNKEELTYGFMQASLFLKKMRKEKGDLILVDCGDSLQGSPLVDYYVNELYGKNTNPVIDVMNYLNYDVAIPGNHDFDYGKDFFESALNESKFKWISANIFNKNDNQYIQPVTIVERNGIKIGFFGLTTPITQLSQHPRNVNGLIFKDLTESAKSAVNILKSQNADMIVALVHSGLGDEKSSDKLLENATYQIVENVKGIDVILFGHSHKETSYKTINNTLLCQPGDHLKSLGIVVVELQQRDGKWEVLSKSSTLMPFREYDEDKKLLKTIKSVTKNVEDYLDKKVGILHENIRFSNTPFNPGDSFKTYYKAISSFAKPDVLMMPIPEPNKLLINDEAVLTRSDLYKVDMYNNYLVMFKIHGHDLKSLMEYSAAMLNLDGTLKSYIPAYNCDSFYNCQLSVDLSKEYGDKVTINSINGKEFKENEYYTVVSTTYRFGGGGHYFIGERPEVVKYSNNTLRNMFLEILDKKE